MATKKHRAREAQRGTKLDPGRSQRAASLSPHAKEKAAPRGMSAKEKLTQRFFMGVEILLVVVPFVSLGLAGSLNLDAASTSNLQELMAQNPRFLVSFLAACLQPFAAYLIHIAYRHYKNGDGGYAMGNLVGILCAEMLMQSVPGVAGVVLLLWRIWRPAASESAVWRQERGAAGVLKDLSGSLVIIAFAAVCAFASWRLNNG